MSNRPLQGVKVLDFSRVVAGPYATRLMSDLGADVLKVEPPEGDLTRKLGPKTEGASGYYIQQNIGKRNICIDLRAEGARELILKLAEEADVVVENFRPGVMDKFGIGWDALHEINPRLVMVSISGFGQSGPERGRAAYAPIVHAEAGLLSRQADFSDSAADIQMSVADTFSSLHGLIGLLAALRVAEQTGVGQHVDVAMIAALHSSDDYAPWALDQGWPKPAENVIWEAPEDERVLISGDMRWIWHLLSTKLGVQDPTPEGADLSTKIKLRRDAIENWVKTQPDFKTLSTRLDELNLAWGRVRAFGADGYSQQTVVEDGIVVEIEDDAGETRQTIQSPYRFSHSQSGITSESRAPAQGEHNISALADWLSLDADTVGALEDAGILLKEP